MQRQVLLISLIRGSWRPAAFEASGEERHGVTPDEVEALAGDVSAWDVGMHACLEENLCSVDVAGARATAEGLVHDKLADPLGTRPETLVAQGLIH
jgi:hypothetical protein